MVERTGRAKYKLFLAKGKPVKPPGEPPPGATRKELLAAARRWWNRFGYYPDWYHTRKKELDKAEKLC